MRNLKFILILTISCFPVWLAAKQVSPETARQVAETQVQSNNQLRSAQELNLVFTKTTDNKTVNASFKASGSAPADILYYVFNAGDKGFVIVSGDDIAKPVLGYSNAGTYDPDNLPPNLVYYLGCLSNEIKDAIDQGITQDEKTKEQWEGMIKNDAALRAATSETAVAPLLDGVGVGIKWGQAAPYNAMCPQYSGNATVTGCVATAMAQIMRFHKYPTQGKGVIPAYTTSTSNLSIPSKDLSTDTYIWDNMLPQYQNYIDYSGTVQGNAVATLMYDCAISVTMDFNTESAASILDAGTAFYTNFSYSPSITHKMRAYYSDTEWNALLTSEIDSGRPVLYGGQDTDGGHAFVCDGYKDDGSFHFNWGWSGSYNGYFQTATLNPYTYHFNNSQEILVNIIPNTTGAQSYEMILGDAVSGPMVFSSTTSQVNTGETLDVTANYYLNIGYFPVTGYMGLALYNTSNVVVQTWTVPDLHPFNPNSGWSLGSVTLNIPPSLLPGDYLLKPILMTSSNKIIPVHTSVVLPLKVTNNTSLEPVVELTESPVNVYESNGSIRVTSDATNPIKEVNVYSLQGALMYKANAGNAISYTIEQKLPAGVYIVKVISEKNTDNVKLVIH